MGSRQRADPAPSDESFDLFFLDVNSCSTLKAKDSQTPLQIIPKFTIECFFGKIHFTLLASSFECLPCTVYNLKTIFNGHEFFPRVSSQVIKC